MGLEAFPRAEKQSACLRIFSKVTSWTVHGIWPTKAGTKGPHNCQKLPFDITKLTLLEPRLLEFWPNVFAGKSVYSLWKHEWTKHGTCAAELPSIGDERDYFALGLAWVGRYQMLPLLAAGGVRPGAAAYSWSQVRDALRARFSHHMVVDCELDTETKRWYLSQIKICLDKSFELMDCHNHVDVITTNCPAEGILYPPIVPTPAAAARSELCQAYVTVAAAEQPVGNITWDFLIFTQQWPQTTCIAYKGENSQHACEIFSNVTSWTVHGIWPTKAGTKGPHNCQKLPFDITKLTLLEPRLLEFWPNVFAGKSVYSLWKHEWTKHGTCAAELPSIGDERDYFALGLAWVGRYQMLPLLAAGGVRPGAAAYSWSQVRDALRARFSHHMVVDCELDTETKRWYLSQIKICLDKSFELMDCHNHVDVITTNCPAEGILYPPIVPTPAPAARSELVNIVEVQLLADEPPQDLYRSWYGLRV
ncbi:uncharacterized protein LOC119108322 [Pollicipes pollicipes]|uniref:uncharacterized protein LOC119108322 n=1 Tax=Pollicipes pollicipes TaxID=41117 RepID=UPI001884DE69|nr:uncharacterized protein LOC119108322 [Pollicipes pollicipes]